MVFGNRSEDSFIRLTQGKEAPNTFTWGKFNRKALIRLPVVARDEDGRAVSPPTIEFRLPDGSAHPHLLLAGIAQGLLYGRGLKDIDKLLMETEASAGGSGTDGAAPVPKNRKEVAAALEKNRSILEVGAVFPAHVIDRLIENLRK